MGRGHLQEGGGLAEKPVNTRALIDALRAVPVAVALSRLGCKPVRRGRMGPCPACGGSEVLVGDVVWRCFRCDVRMDVVGTFRHLGNGWEGASALAANVGLWDDREPNRVPVVKWRDPMAERREADERWWWVVLILEAEERHAEMWAFVDAAMAEPEYRQMWEDACLT